MLRTIAITVGLVGGAAAWANCEAQSTDASLHSSVQVVVLRNGNVLQGSVQNINRRLVISDGDSRITRVSLDDVDFICPDLQMAYRRKLARLRSESVEQHLRLAQWCIRYELHDAAIDRLLHLNRIAPHHSAVKAFEKRMRRLASEQGESYTNPTRDDESVNDVTPATSIYAVGEIASFSRGVQPLLINRCGQNNCHGDASKNGFRMTRGLRGSPNREETQRNLLAVLAQLRPHDFESSPLLLKARMIHGNSRTSPIEPHELKQYARLYEWVKSIGEKTPEPQALPVAQRTEAQRTEAQPPETQRFETQRTGTQRTGTQRTGTQRTDVARRLDEARGLNDSPATADGSPLTGADASTQGRSDSSPHAVDPFDPSPFNEAID